MKPKVPNGPLRHERGPQILFEGPRASQRSLKPLLKLFPVDKARGKSLTAEDLRH